VGSQVRQQICQLEIRGSILEDMTGINIIVACTDWVVTDGTISNNSGGFKAVSEAGVQ
jgi:hypothetical protein